jgi:disulfide oxidoreductase YuzD
MGKNIEIKWQQESDEKDFPAAASYLGLLYDKYDVKSLIKKLKYSKSSQFKAKDIFRASGLSLLGVSNFHVEKELKKIEDNEDLSPILLVRDEKNKKVIIADGYHRMCAVYSFNEDAYIPCKIV